MGKCLYGRLRVACVARRDLHIYPWEDAGDPGIDTRVVGTGAIYAPGYHSDEGVPAVHLMENNFIGN